MKKLLCVILMFLVLNTKAQTTKPLRYFMQPKNVASSTIPYGNHAGTGKYVQSGDAKIYYEVYGQGAPIVVLHGGIFGSTYEMGNFIDSLKVNHQVIAISTRGHGKSEIGNTAIAYEQKVEDVMAVMNAVTKDSILVLGFSDGAYTGYKLAAMYPERVKKLIAIGAGELIPSFRKIVLDIHEGYKLDSAYWKQQFALMPSSEGLQEFWTKMANFYNSLSVSKTLFATIKCPVLLIAGELDRNAPLSTVIAAYYRIPKSQLAIIPNAGHTVFLENFTAVWAVIQPFIKN